MPIILHPGYWDKKLAEKEQVDRQPHETRSWIGETLTCEAASCRCEWRLVETDYVYAPIWPGRTHVQCTAYCPSCRMQNHFLVRVSKPAP